MANRDPPRSRDRDDDDPADSAEQPSVYVTIGEILEELDARRKVEWDDEWSDEE